MNEYPYMHATGKLKKFFTDTVINEKVPTTVDQKWLASVGYTDTNNDKKLITILQELNFIDEAGKPTNAYSDFRDQGKRKETMLKALETGYSDLYKTFDNAHERDKDTISNFIKVNKNVSANTAEEGARTLKVLAIAGEMVSDEGPSIQKVVSRVRKTPTKLNVQTSDKSKEKQEKGSDSGQNMTPKIEMPLSLAINVQFVLPETKDPEVFKVIFSELRKFYTTESKE